MRLALRHTICSAVCAVALAAPAVLAQELRGNVTLPGSTTGVAGVIVEATDSASGRLVGRALTGAQGAFVLRIPADAPAKVRALRIGNLPTVFGTIRLAAGEVRRERIELTGAAVTLDRVEVISDRVCRMSASESSQVLALFDESRKAISATQLAGATGGRMTAEWAVQSQLASLRGVPLGDPTARTYRAPSEQPFVSLSPDSLAKVGYVSTDGDNWTYWAPDARVLLSDEFVQQNCFQAVPWTADSSDWVGLRFSPAARPVRGIVGIEGVLWLDRGSAELRRLEYDYVGVPREIAGTPAGGSVEFLRLPSGNWLVNRWSIRMPRPTTYVDHGFGNTAVGGNSGSRQQTTRTTRITSMEVASGRVLEVRRGAGVVYRAPNDERAAARDAGVASLCIGANGSARPMVWGTLRDSAGTGIGSAEIKVAWQDGHRYYSPMNREWENQEQSTSTSASGLWYLCDVPLNRRLEIRADASALSERPHLVFVTDAAQPVEVKLGVVVGRGGTIEGTVVDSLTGGEPWGNVEVRVLGTSLTARTDGGGNYRIRRVPAGTHTVVIDDPRAVFFGLPPSAVTTVVSGDGALGRADLATISPSALYRRLCGVAWTGAEGVLVGEVRDVNGARREGMVVDGGWSRLTVARGSAEREDLARSDTTAADGRYVLCGVPMGGDVAGGGGGAATLVSGEIALRAAGGTLRSGAVSTGLGGAIVSRRDLIVGSDERTATLSGRVLDILGVPIKDALVSVVGRAEAAVRTDDRGQWRIERVPIASTQVLVRAIRFLPRVVDLEPTRGRFAAGEVKLDRIPQELASVVVEGQRMSPTRAGFEERKKAGVGTFLDDTWVARMPELTVANVRAMIPKTRMMRDPTPGLTNYYKIAFEVDGGTGGNASVESMAQGVMRTCFPRWYVDGADFGIPTGPEEQQLLSQAKRIEAYRAMEMPQRYIDFNGCGVIVISTLAQ